MNNKILLGSIIAVVIIVLVSFTGVVGYQTTSTTIAKASPLFSVRASRAIDEDSKDIACDYVGKGAENVLSIPNRDDEMSPLHRLINTISQMNENEFNSYINHIIQRLLYQNIIRNKQISKVRIAITELRENTKILNVFNPQKATTSPYTSYPCCGFISSGLPMIFCNILGLIISILGFLGDILFFILDFIEDSSGLKT